MSKTMHVMLVSLITNFFLSLLKVITGIIGKSGALVADGIHSLSDLTTDMVAILGDRFSKIPADKEHPDGHGKLEYVTSIIIGTIILFLGLSLIGNIFNSTVTTPTNIVVYITIITIIIKFILSEYIIKKGYKYKNNILISSGKESRADMLSSVVVLVSFIFTKLTFISEIFRYADKVGTILVGLFIMRVGFIILRENILTVLGETESKEYTDYVENIILQNKTVKKVDSLSILKYGSYYKLIGEISMDGDLSLVRAHEIADDIEDRLKQDKKIKYVTIHINPYNKEEK